MSTTPAIRFEGFAEPWEQRKLGDVAERFEYGLNAAATEFDGANKYLRITDIDDDTREFRLDDLTTPQANLEICSNYLLEEGDLLFARTGASVGKTYLYRPFDGKVYFAGFLIRARIGNEADPEFVFQSTLTERYQRYISITSQRSGQPGVNAQEYAEFEIPLPLLPEQREIGSLLHNLDNLITLHQRKHDRLVVLKKALLDKMFPRDGSRFPELRFGGFTDPWEQRKLDELATFGGGHTPSMADESNYADGEILWVTSQDVKVDYLSDTTTKLSEKGASELKLYPPGTLLMVTRSGILRHTLPVSMLRKPSTVNQDIRTINTNEDCSSLWLMQHLKAHSKELLLEYGKTGTTVESVDFAKMKSMALMLPAPDEQRAIGGFFYQLDNLITLHQRKLELLRNLKSACLDKMFV